MRSSEVADRDGVIAALDRFRASCAEMAELPLDALTIPEQFTVLETIETGRRQLPAAEHRALNTITTQATPEQLGGPVHSAIADRLHITPAEARRRVRDAALLGPRPALTGEPLEPAWPAVAAAQAAGQINTEHIREIGRFFKQLPCAVDDPTRAHAETTLARHATQLRPDELRVAADRMAAHLNPGGLFSDADRARKRGLIIGAQDIDGMSPISGHLTPEARATLDAVLAKWAAPGMCNPDDHTPTLDGAPTEAAIHADRRSRGQRNQTPCTRPAARCCPPGSSGR